MNRKQLFGSILLTLTALIWGVAFVAQRSGSDKIGAATFTSSRMTLATRVIRVTNVRINAAPRWWAGASAAFF